MMALFFLLMAHTGPAPGMAALIRQNGAEELRVSGRSILPEGPEVSEQTCFRMASVSKQFTAACIILLKNEGKLSYEDPLDKFFPGFDPAVRLKHLLTHTSGLYDYEGLIPAGRTEQVSDADVLKWVSGTGATYFVPGSRYRYSNSGFCILSQVVEKVSGQPYAEFLKKRILGPLGMDHSFIYRAGEPMPARALGYALQNDKVTESDQSVTSATKGDGCLYTSLADYRKWMDAIVNNRLFNLEQELKQANYRIKEDLFYGLGWFNTGGNELFHTGSTCGFSNVVWLTLDGRNALVYFSNLADHHAPAFVLENGLKFRKPAFALEKVLTLTD